MSAGCSSTLALVNQGLLAQNNSLEAAIDRYRGIVTALIVVAK